jgi:glycosyltransferase involved in cell wall biosynthesis
VQEARYARADGIAHHKAGTPAVETIAPRKTLHLGLAQGENYGWGVCSKYLTRELSRRANVVQLLGQDGQLTEIDGTVFVAIGDADFNPVMNVKGTETYGYTFFETELGQAARENAKRYDTVLAGSTWCLEKLREKGIHQSHVLIQGVDPDLFYPITERKPDNLFVIFSGGKFEYRKGQDLVLKAFQILQKKYHDIVLINCWYNLWPHSVSTMGMSRHICFEPRGESWQAMMEYTYKLNGLERGRIITCGLTPNHEMRSLFAKTDIGVFPNRCEGGTNLVLMEYMACAKPVIASYTSGHKDVVNENNALVLRNLGKHKILNKGVVVADWDEPSLDELVDRIEYAYHNRETVREVGRRAGEEMRKFTWGATAENLLKTIA